MPKTFYEEIHCKTVLNRVNGGNFSFRWTINPYRGCQHACVYCFARKTHEYLGYDIGHDFDHRIVVKVNAPSVLRQELRRPGWKRELIALGTACDPYQQAETRYRITRGIITALRDSANPVSILTKSTIITQDLDLLKELASVASLTVSFSVGTLNEEIWQRVEPGTPRPIKRLESMGRLAKAGIRTGIMLAPILPELTDTPESLNQVIRAAAEYGAQHVLPIVLHLRPGSKEWFMPFLREAYPYLTPQYQRLYKGAYAPASYTQEVYEVVEALKEKWGFSKSHPPVESTWGQQKLPI